MRLNRLLYIWTIFTLVATSATAGEPPDTIIIAGPTGTVGYNDLAFWSSGKVSDLGTLPSIKGFYYRLDGGPWNWTQDRFIAYYDVENGSHRLEVKAVDSNNLEDPSPAVRDFTVWQNVSLEPKEFLFSLSLEFQSDLDKQIISESLQREFSFKGVFLSKDARVSISEGKWLINDGDKTYIIRESADKLDVYQPVNDTSSSAVSVEPNRTIKCESRTGADGVDEDWFKVRILSSEPTRQISLFLRRPEGDFSSIVKLYRSPEVSPGKEIASFEVRDRGFCATGIAPGDYFIHVRPTLKSDLPSVYYLTIATDSLIPEVAWDREFNDSSSSAMDTSPVFLSDWMEIVGDRRGDSDSRDWFKVHLKTEGRKRLSLNLTRPRLGSMKVSLYAVSPLSLLGEFTVAPDSGPQWKLELGAALGDYLLEIDLSEDLSRLPYFLTLRISDFPQGEVWELEPNNYEEFVDQLDIGVRVKADRGHADDVDWFGLTIPKEGILSLSASRIAKSGSISIDLLDPVGQPIADFALLPGSQKNILNFGVSPGKYLIRVGFADFVGNYWLSALLVTSVEHNIGVDEVLAKGDKLSVKLVWERGNFASADIMYDGMSRRLNKEPILLYDDGLHGDEERNDGIYAGTYIVGDKDNVTGGIVVVHIRDQAGNTSDILIDRPISIDTTPPVITLVSHSASAPLSAGQTLSVTIRGEPNNNATFEISTPAGETRITGIAYDDGKHDDGDANDGEYSGTYIIKPEDYIASAIVTGYLTDSAGNSANLSAVIRVDIVGDRPVIFAVSHTGRLMLGRGDVLTVALIGDPECIASFDIKGLVNNVPMYDDGGHDDGERGDGKYVGTYTVAEGDGVLSAEVTAHLIDRKGRSSEKTAALSVNIDAVPPAPVRGVSAVDRPEDQGRFISVKWSPAEEIDFAHYNIFLSEETPIPVSKGRIVGLSPVISDITDPKQVSIDIKVSADLKDYFVAVTAVDIMGNESLLNRDGGSVAGPVQAKDNLRPAPVKIVKAVDRDQDFGGVIIISWTDINKDEDFARYNIYQDTNPILTTVGRSPIDVVTDRQLNVVDVPVESDTLDYYFAVTAVDLSGNESELSEFSVSGPVRAESDLPPEPSAPLMLSGPIGIIHHNHIAFHWNRFDSANMIHGYYIRLDDGNWQWTTSSTAVYHDLSPGSHKFSVRLPQDLSGFTIERSFEVVPAYTSERADNNSRERAQSIRSGMIVKGDGSDNKEDWFRVHIPPSTAACVMDILLSYPGGINPVKFEVYSDRFAGEIAHFDGNSPMWLALGVVPESDYFLRIEPAGTSYNLVVTVNKLREGLSWEVENNDSIASANSLTVDDQLSDIEVRGDSSSPDSGGDPDWFKVHIAASTKKWMNVYLSSIGSMKVYSSTPSVRQIGEVSGGPTGRPFTGLITPGHDYFLEVLNEEDSAYQFLVLLSSAPVVLDSTYEVEPNDFFASANLLKEGIPCQGTNWDGDKDIDLYRLDIEGKGFVSVGFARPSGKGISIIEIYNSIQEMIGSFSVSADTGQRGNIVLRVSAGTYYVKISPQNEDPSALYSLSALFVSSIKVTCFSSDGKELRPEDRPLRAGDKIIIEMVWKVKGGKARFSIGDRLDVLRQALRTSTMIEREDGIYEGVFTVTEGDDMVSPLVTVHIEDPTFNTQDFRLLDERVPAIDTTPPQIIEVSHDGKTPLASGKLLTVRMIGTPRSKARFDIGEFKTGLDMFNFISNEVNPTLVVLSWDWLPDPEDNRITVFGEVKNLGDPPKNLVKVNITFYDANNEVVSSDSTFTAPSDIPSGVTASFKKTVSYTGREKSAKLRLVYDTDEKVVGEIGDEGVYVGIYKVADSDNVSSAKIICYLVDSAGNWSSAESKERVTFDNIPPIIKSLTHSAEGVLVEGDTLTVTLEGDPGGFAEFDIGGLKTGIAMSPLQGEPGKYIGTYLVRAGDRVDSALIIGHLKDAAGNEALTLSAFPVSINTSAPVISSVVINGGRRPFAEGEVLLVTVTTEPGMSPTFDVEGLLVAKPMYDDGEHNDGAPGDGVYVGSYIVKKGDNVKSARVKVTVVSPNGKSAQRFALEPISVDTEPPPAVIGFSAEDKPDDNGGYVILSWSPSSAEDFSHYNIYMSEQPIVWLSGLEPKETITDREVREIELAVPLADPGSPALSYYFAITASDFAGNESSLGRGSVAGPVSSIDNLPPPPVRKVSGYDRAYDNGKVIVITWSEPSPAPDFHHYNIYMGEVAIDTNTNRRIPPTFVLVDSSITDRNILQASVSVPENGVGYFWGVTAVDTSNNESDITADSIAGPIWAEDNLGTPPETLVQIISGPMGEINHNDVTFRWQRWVSAPESTSPSLLTGYYYKLDDNRWVWTNETSKTFYDLSDGQHNFYIRADLGTARIDPLPAERVFSVRRISISEREPNNVPEQANWISKGVTVFGTNKDDNDDDWLRFHVESADSPILLTLHFERIRGKGSTNVTVFRSLPPTDSAIIGILTVDPMAGQSRAEFSGGVELGDYFILIDSQGEDPSARYELSVVTDELISRQDGYSLQWDRENNDLPGSSQLIGRWDISSQIVNIPVVEVSGSSNRANDVDWYKLQVFGVKPGVSVLMRLDFTRPQSSGTTDVSVFSLAVSDAGKIGFISYSPALLPVRTIYLPISSGDYFLKVESSPDTDVSSIYTFGVSFSLPSEKWEIEPNGVSVVANSLSVGESIKGTSWHPDDDLDCFKVRIGRQGRMVISAFRPFGMGSTEVKLLSADAGEIAKQTLGPLTGQKADVSAVLGPGDYFVVLDPSGEGDPLAEYQLSVVVIDTECYLLDDGVYYSISDVRRPASVGDVIKLSVAWQAGNFLSFDVGDLQMGLDMYDNGLLYDSSAGDGTYVGTYTVQKGDKLTDGKIKLHLAMPPGGTARLPTGRAESFFRTADIELEYKITIDTIPPEIVSVDHNGTTQPMSAGSVLNVTMTGEPGLGSAFFHIRTSEGDIPPRYFEIPMKEESAGIYSGSFTITEGDNIDGGIVVCYLVDKAGNESSRSAIRPIFFDTTPPEIIKIEHNAKKTLLEGDVLVVSAVSDTKGGKATFSIGELVAAVPMYDDGTHMDSSAGDGVFTGLFTVKKGDNADNALISVHLSDPAGNSVEGISFEPVSIDTTPPQIISFVHDAKRILSKGDKLTVTLKGDPGNFATFDIGEIAQALPMYDDGTRGDERANDGVYVGTYIVKEGDLAKNSRVTGYLTDAVGNRTVNSIFERVDIDAVPPPPIVGVHGEDKPQDQGFWIILSWEVESIEGFEDFDRYNIYRETTPIVSLKGLTPLVDSSIVPLGQIRANRVEVNVPSNGVNFYFAVTAVDTAGNESRIDTSPGGSVFGPVLAIDNIAPEPVTVVSAFDRPKDQGKTILVTWTPPLSEDFDHYGIYMSEKPITSLQGMKPVMTATAKQTIEVTGDGEQTPGPTRRVGIEASVPYDGVDFYFAVTAFDKSGNESPLDSEGRSSTGPVRSKDDIPPQPITFVDAVDTPGDDGGFINVTWLPNEDEKIQSYNLYISQYKIEGSLRTLEPAVRVSPESALRVDTYLRYMLRTSVSPVYVAVTAVDFGGNESSLDESGGSSAGPVYSVSNRVKAGSVTKISAGFDPGTFAEIPASAMDGNETVDILWPEGPIWQRINEANQFRERSHIDESVDDNFSDTVREFKSSTSRLRKPVTITLSYPDVTEMKSGSGILSQDDERQFRIFKLNEVSRIPKWDLVPGDQKVDTWQNSVSVQIDSFGVFRVAKLKLPQNLDKVVVYPNPFIPSQSINGYITFKNLTENATVQIYSVDGEIVKAIKKVGGGDEITWDARNEKEEEVASGTYVFVIQNESQTFVGKVVILR